MTVQVNSEGDFVENAVSNADSPENADVLSDLYDVMCKSDMDEGDYSIESLAHEVRRVFGDETGDDSDISKWCHLNHRENGPEEAQVIPKSSEIDSEPNIGRYFWKAVDYTANDYQDFSDKYSSELNVQPLGDVNEEGETLKSYLIESEVVESEDTVYVPVNSDGDLIPPFVVSDERQEQAGLEMSLPTYEEGLSRYEQLLSDHFGETTTVETSDKQEDGDGESDTEDHLLSEVDKVGPATAENIKEFLVENRETLDWRNHIDGEEWQNAPVVITKDEARERLQQVALEMDNDEFTDTMQAIERGDTNQAVAAIKQYE